MQLIYTFVFLMDDSLFTKDELHDSILPWIGKTGKMLHVFMNEKFKDHDINLTLEQFIILRVLNKKDGLPQQDLAFITQRHKATLTRVLGSMEKKNLIARIPDPGDRRVNKIYLTTHGQKFYSSTLPALKEAIVQVQQSLSQNEIDFVISIMKKVQKDLVVP